MVSLIILQCKSQNKDQNCLPPNCDPQSSVIRNNDQTIGHLAGNVGKQCSTISFRPLLWIMDMKFLAAKLSVTSHIIAQVSVYQSY